MWLAQGHNTVTPPAVSLNLATFQSPVLHSTDWATSLPLCSWLKWNVRSYIISPIKELSLCKTYLVRCLLSECTSISWLLKSFNSLRIIACNKVHVINVLSITIRTPKGFVCLFCCFTSQVNSYGHAGMVSSHKHTFFLGKLEQTVNQYFVHILSLVTDNNPSWMIQWKGGEWP